jgi:3-hydroxyacyl-CoA dehydrogenase
MEETMEIKHIFVVGAGTMGNGIVQTAATSGYQVTIWM